MRFSDIKNNIVNRMGFESIDAIRQAGYRLVKTREGERYLLARPTELQPLLVKLGDIAEVRRGFTTGANEFFYLEPVGVSVAELFRNGIQQPSLPTVRVRNGAGWQGELETAWLRPVIKSPRELKTLRVRLEDLRYLVFMPPAEFFSPSANSLASATNPEKKILDDVRQRLQDTAHLKQRYPKAHAYIQWGEKQGYHLRPTCKSRVKWWDLGKWDHPDLFWSDTYNTRFAVGVNTGSIYGDKRFFLIWLGTDFVPAAYLNSIVTFLNIEVSGIANLGEGALYTNVYWLQSYLVMTGDILRSDQRDRLLEAFERMANREVRSIFEELGYPKPNRDYSNIDPHALTLEQVQRASPDRFELDAVVFEVLGLSDAERLAVYRAVVELVRNRLVKARSV